MSDVPIRPQAVEDAAKAMHEAGCELIPGKPWDELYESVRNLVRKEARAGIEAFLAAEEIAPERMNAQPEHQGEDWIPEVRLCGPWRRDDG